MARLREANLAAAVYVECCWLTVGNRLTQNWPAESKEDQVNRLEKWQGQHLELNVGMRSTLTYCGCRESCHGSRTLCSKCSYFAVFLYGMGPDSLGLRTCSCKSDAAINSCLSGMLVWYSIQKQLNVIQLNVLERTLSKKEKTNWPKVQTAILALRQKITIILGKQSPSV